MRVAYLFCFTASILFSTVDLCGQCGGGTRTVVRRKSGNTTNRTSTVCRPVYPGKIYGGEMPRKEWLDREIKREAVGTKKYVLLVQERERIALTEIHKAQKYLLSKRGESKHSEKYRESTLTLREEIDFMQPTLDYIRDFPFAKEMHDIIPTLQAIREGKISFEDCRGKNLTKILNEIHDAQRKRLNVFQKNYLEKNF